VLDGLTELETIFVKAASLYHVEVPLLHVADKVELCPEHIEAGLAEIAVGAVGVGFTVTVILPEVLLQPVLLKQAT
jgi:hypothetical protein